jgi:hypothetical protein
MVLSNRLFILGIEMEIAHTKIAMSEIYNFSIKHAYAIIIV